MVKVGKGRWPRRRKYGEKTKEVIEKVSCRKRRGVQEGG